MTGSIRPVAEFDIIEILRDRCAVNRCDVLLGIGDDAAVTHLPAGSELVTATDALVEGTHFLPGAPAASIGHRCLAVNLSDLAAMGAEPRWATLALALPQADRQWVAEFADGFARLARRFGVSLIGGDTVRGALSATVTVLGAIPAGQLVSRGGAQPGDRIFLSGMGGRSAAGRRVQAGELAAESTRATAYARHFEFPEPRVALGIALRPLVSAMIDVSDGVHVDLQRLLEASGVGAELRLPDLAELEQDFGIRLAHTLFLSGGEDYELCFTAPPDKADSIAAVAAENGIDVLSLGVVSATAGLRWIHDGREVDVSDANFEHFQAG